MRFQLAASAAVSLLILTSASTSSADKGRGKGQDAEVPTSFNKQFEWEEKVVGPKAGLDKNRVAAIQEQGRREEEARKKEPPKKAERAKGVDAPATEALPTMDIEKPAAPTAQEAEEGGRRGAEAAGRARQPARRAGGQAEQPPGRGHMAWTACSPRPTRGAGRRARRPPRNRAAAVTDRRDFQKRSKGGARRNITPSSAIASTCP